MIYKDMFGISAIDIPYDKSMLVVFRDFKNKDVLDCIKIPFEDCIKSDNMRKKVDKFVNEIKEISGIWEVKSNG